MELKGMKNQYVSIRCFFTLIELLVVMAIIAVLAAMLLPALSKAREKGKSIRCTGNQKQISIGFDMYCSDFSDLFPLSYGPVPDSTLPAAYYNLIYPYVNTRFVNISWNTMGHHAAFYCPSTKKHATGWYNLTTYMMNGYIGAQQYGMTVNSYRRRTKVKNPSTVFLAGEGRNGVNSTSYALGKYSFTSAPLGEELTDINGGSLKSKIAIRHGRNVIFTYVDGHVGNVPYEEFSLWVDGSPALGKYSDWF